jgi:hypothetical protein
MYEIGSSTTNPRNHIAKEHTVIYDKTIIEKNWHYPLSTEVPGAKTTIGELRKHALPRFTIEVFIEYLVRFIVADDQVSNYFLLLTHVLILSQSIRVVDCPEFRDLCMLLRESLQDSDIPHRDRVRQGIIDDWHKWFKGLQQELKVCPSLRFAAHELI